MRLVSSKEVIAHPLDTIKSITKETMQFNKSRIVVLTNTETRKNVYFYGRFYVAFLMTSILTW